jgi:hypothetical protein
MPVGVVGAAAKARKTAHAPTNTINAINIAIGADANLGGRLNNGFAIVFLGLDDTDFVFVVVFLAGTAFYLTRDCALAQC